MSGQNSQKSQIDRYYIEMEGDICGPVLMERVDSNGEWVRYEDHKAEIETLTRKLDTCGLECSEGLNRLASENERLRACLSSIQGCGSCAMCSGAAKRALGGEPAQSDTPRTDNEWKFSVPGETGLFVRIEFARILEHELNRAQDDVIKIGASKLRPAHEREPPHCSSCGCGLGFKVGDRVQWMNHLNNTFGGVVRSVDMDPRVVVQFDDGTLRLFTESKLRAERPPVKP